MQLIIRRKSYFILPISISYKRVNEEIIAKIISSLITILTMREVIVISFISIFSAIEEFIIKVIIRITINIAKVKLIA